jgi:hypothetical protein
MYLKLRTCQVDVLRKLFIEEDDTTVPPPQPDAWTYLSKQSALLKTTGRLQNVQRGQTDHESMVSSSETRLQKPAGICAPQAYRR